MPKKVGENMNDMVQEVAKAAGTAVFFTAMAVVGIKLIQAALTLLGEV